MIEIYPWLCESLQTIFLMILITVYVLNVGNLPRNLRERMR